jgi:4-hydroxybenzoate polyprenyltransferase
MTSSTGLQTQRAFTLAPPGAASCRRPGGTLFGATSRRCKAKASLLADPHGNVGRKVAPGVGGQGDGVHQEQGLPLLSHPAVGDAAGPGGFQPSTPAPPPLVIDLDGTLIRTDLLSETTLLYLKRAPWRIARMLLWLMAGRARLKREVGRAVALDLNLLPARQAVVAFAEAAAQERPVYVATASDGELAAPLMQRFDFLSGVIGSDGATNLKGARKAQALQARFPQGFDYIGDARADFPVWAAARIPIYGGARAGVGRRLKARRPEAVILPEQGAGLRLWIKAVRLHQWSKNALLLVPLLLGGKALDGGAWARTAVGFLAMGVMASSTYVLNDLLDLQEDRAHWSKRDRAFASGRIALEVGALIVPVGLAAALALGMAAGGAAGAAALCAYLALTLLYSFRLKREPIVDVLALGGLFTLRLAVGVVFARVAWSAWLMVFSMFLFTSLSLAKRLTEVERAGRKGATTLAGRGYVARDAPLLLGLGVSLTAAAILVLVLYLIEEAFRIGAYRAPQILWVFPLVLALWLGRIWLLCGRGELNDDPVAFAVRDRTSLILGALMTAALLAALAL